MSANGQRLLGLYRTCSLHLMVFSVRGMMTCSLLLLQQPRLVGTLGKITGRMPYMALTVDDMSAMALAGDDSDAHLSD